MKRSASLATRANTKVSFAVVNCTVKTLNREDQHHSATSEVH
ncbi:TPA: hypothetical protein ACNVZ8_002469 [Citrobacter freundii]|nr:MULTISPECIES: hypothetical protein [Citrobacter]MDM3176060.1 hypothetical protein [Citrobacter sp. Cf112]MDT7065098.1 hypothetical protein [Citrobacter freundii]MDT7080154.1 hypothetical protein [Citrobacter freundii]MDT7105061.1 hypothetical protein [Citrobacter freundii]MDT7111918.1 hypothetical protein [Citrobacter freundii]